jgi:putative transcription factor
MSKKLKTNIDNQCPICGGVIWKGEKVLIEGAKITVCQSCAQYGKKIPKGKKPITTIRPKTTPVIMSSTQKTSKSDDILEPSIEIIPDFAQKMRDIRTKLNLNQEKFAKKLNEKPSLIKRIESGKVEPSLKLAKKIEEVYNLKLLKEKDIIEVNLEKYMKKPSATSLGDIAFIKKRKE